MAIYAGQSFIPALVLQLLDFEPDATAVAALLEELKNVFCISLRDICLPVLVQRIVAPPPPATIGRGGLGLGFKATTEPTYATIPFFPVPQPGSLALFYIGQLRRVTRVMINWRPFSVLVNVGTRFFVCWQDALQRNAQCINYLLAIKPSLLVRVCCHCNLCV